MLVTNTATSNKQTVHWVQNCQSFVHYLVLPNDSKKDGLISNPTSAETIEKDMKEKEAKCAESKKTERYIHISLQWEPETMFRTMSQLKYCS